MFSFFSWVRRIFKPEVAHSKPVHIKEALPCREDLDNDGCCWLGYSGAPGDWILDNPEQCVNWDQWLPAHAIPRTMCYNAYDPPVY